MQAVKSPAALRVEKLHLALLPLGPTRSHLGSLWTGRYPLSRLLARPRPTHLSLPRLQPPPPPLDHSIHQRQRYWSRDHYSSGVRSRFHPLILTVLAVGSELIQ